MEARQRFSEVAVDFGNRWGLPSPFPRWGVAKGERALAWTRPCLEPALESRRKPQHEHDVEF